MSWVCFAFWVQGFGLKAYEHASWTKGNLMSPI